MAESGRDDYDRLIRFSQLEPGEPYFFLRGRDQVAAQTVRAWAALAHKAGADPAIVESALRQADRLDAYPSKQLPDADHLKPAERQDLAYSLQRRAWNHRIAHAPNETVLLAEQRGFNQARAEDRHADRLLDELADALEPLLEKSKAGADEIARARKVLDLIMKDRARRQDLPWPPSQAPVAEKTAAA